MSKDIKPFPKMAVMSLIVAMGTLFTFQPAGAIGLDHHENENQHPKEGQQRVQPDHGYRGEYCDPATDPECEEQRDGDQQRNRDGDDREQMNRDQNQPRVQQQQKRDTQQKQDQQRQRDQQQECSPESDPNCVCHMKRDDDQRQQQRRDQDQQRQKEQERNQQDPEKDKMACEPSYNEYCECYRESSEDMKGEQQQQKQQQNQQDQQEQRKQPDQKQQDQKRVTPTAAVEHDHLQDMDLSSFYFDSGWVSVRSGTNYMFNHNFGSIPTYVVVHQCGQIDKNQDCVGPVVIAGERGYHDGASHINPIQIVSDKGSLEVVLGNFQAWGIWDPQRGWECPQDEDKDCNTAYYRVQAFK